MDKQQILALNAFAAADSLDLGEALCAQVRRRAQLFGAASVLFYARPLELVRGAGCWLYAADGTAYLDAYNNVPSVGHCHPHVIEAVTRQLRELNIHSRYLHPRVLDYAERLTAKLPTALSNITFTCTGSESNDLALRLAASLTGARGVIVTESAYHGNTGLGAEVSPALVKRGDPEPHVRYVPAPHTLRVPAAELSSRFASHVHAAIQDLKRCGSGFSALLADCVFSSDGICADPPGFMAAAVDAVHEAGGLFIADEVQSGFCRTGDAWWGFERHGLAPDVVTLGKPMGNGFPVGAVVTRPDILEAYCARFGYFNTFGGSPVAAAAGAAVLDVLEQEGLLDNARRVGAALLTALQALARRHPEIADVRGAGLYLGVELHGDSGAGVAARLTGAGDDPVGAVRARTVINSLRERRVLIGAAGMHGNVLKIRPPLCFSAANADQLVEALDQALTDAPAARAGAK